ncbi:MAG: hypothetical protein LBL90_00085 [Prevotellaceae bacterium]|jgi:hypothetical protein|nr:hypothetical protein [Prevotellaceae bacterium]
MKLLNGIKLFAGDFSIFIYLIYLIFRGEVSFNIKFPKTTGDELIIITNGPSLIEDLQTKLELIKEKDTMVVNYFPLDSRFFTIKPKYLALADPAFWSDKNNKYVSDRIDLMADELPKVNWPMIMFIPYFALKGKNTQIRSIQNSFITVKYYNSAAPPMPAHKTLAYFLYNRNILMPKPRNVLATCIFATIKMQYPVVKIIGADHSWLKDLFVSDENVLCLRDKHFNNQAGRMRCFANSPDEDTYKLHEYLYSQYVVFLTYWQLSNYAKTKKVKIYNCTPGSYIDAFERGKL